MGLDIGDRRIGVALSDPGGILASPHTIIECSGARRDVETILGIAVQQQVGRIVVGLPRMMDGSAGGQVKKVEEFVERLRQHTDVPIELRDERLSTVSARRLLKAGGKQARRKTRYDAAAAAVILQSFLEEER